jgi:hypothetical protein
MDINNPVDNRTVMEEQLKQMYEKKLKDQEEKIKRREDELKGYLSLKDDLDRDQKEKEIELVNKRRDFMRAIEDHKQQKQMRNQLDKSNSNDFQYTYFPYTHGDNIEKKRREITTKLKEEMKEHYRHKKTSFLKDTKSNTSAVMSPISGTRDSILDQISQKRSASSSQRSYPYTEVFLKPHKEHLHRFIPDEKLEDNNKKALKRYEEELLEQRKKRLQLEQELKEQNSLQKEFKGNEKERKRRKIEATKKALDEQVKEHEDKKQVEFWENKMHYNTNFGPEEGDELKQLYKQKRDQEKRVLDHELRAQIFVKQTMKETSQQLGDQMDKIYVQQAKELMVAQENELKKKKRLQQNNNVKAWNQQREIKALQNKEK